MQWQRFFFLVLFVGFSLYSSVSASPHRCHCSLLFLRWNVARCKNYLWHDNSAAINLSYKIVVRMKKRNGKNMLDASRRTIKWFGRLYCIASHSKWFIFTISLSKPHPFSLSPLLILFAQFFLLDFESPNTSRIPKIILIRIPIVRTEYNIAIASDKIIVPLQSSRPFFVCNSRTFLGNYLGIKIQW